MSKCEDCNELYDPTQKARFKCAYTQCKVWSHKQCADKKQTSSLGFWHCKTHVNEIPLNLRRSNMHDENEEDQIADETNVIPHNAEKEENSNSSVKIVINKSNENNDEINSQFESIGNDSHKDNCSETQIHKEKYIVPYDDGNDLNPFANFNCEHCEGSFTPETKGALCSNCRSTFHLICLNEQEIDCVRNSKFVCQHCIQSKIRLENLKNKHRAEMKRNVTERKQVGRKVVEKNKSVEIISSTPKVDKVSSHNSRKKYISSSDDSVSSSLSDLSDDLDDQKLRKLKKFYRKHKSNSKKSLDVDSDSSTDDEDANNLSQADAFLSLVKLSQDERNKSRFDKLPIVDSPDTKWVVFFDLFGKSRKLFSDSENVLRIQNSIKCKEILDIGGISLFDPRTYWQALKLVNDRLYNSHNLLQRETNELIKMKKLRYDYEYKKIVDFINKVSNYSFIVDKYGSRKHKVDDRVISHIGNVMPNSLMNGWHKLKTKLEAKDKTICIKHIAEYLSEQVAYISSKLQSEELDPWREASSSQAFKKNDFRNKRSYNTNVAQNSSDSTTESSTNYCWLHKAKGHSAFNCSKLWDLSGKEVSELARKNDICTFCGNRRHRDCHAAKTLKCKIDNCKFKHHILFCYRRKGKIDKVNNNRHDKTKESGSNKDSNTQKKNVEKISRSQKSKKMFTHSTEDPKENTKIPSEESEVEIPPSNFYINDPPKVMRIKPNKVKSKHNATSPPGNNHIRSDSNFHNHSSNAVIKRTASCILGVIVVNFLDGNKHVPLLLDSGSTVSIIEEEVANKLEIKGLWNPLRLNWSSDMNRTDYGSRIIKARVSGTQPNSREFNIYFRTVKDLFMHDQPFDAAEMVDLFPHLQPMNLTSYKKIYGIIGVDNLWVFDQIKVFKPHNWTPSIPYGIRSPLGDFVVGNVHQLEEIYDYLRQNSNVNINFLSYSQNNMMAKDEESELVSLEREILGHEYRTLDPNDENLFEDNLALDILNKKVRRSENNVNFEAPLLWRNDDVVLPTAESYKIAVRRLMIVEKNSIKNGRFQECIDQVDNLLSKNYAEIVPPDELYASHNKVFYIPTFFIQPKNKRTRFIWDGASKVGKNSLNDHLLAGPNLYNSYLHIIFQMQEGKFLVKGDLQEMFHQILIRKEDRDSLRFLFRRSPQDKIQVLRMRVMIFGSKCSPATSQFVIKNKIANSFLESKPDAANVIMSSTYVDDVITSTDDLTYSKSLIRDVRDILKSGGFNLVNFDTDEIRVALTLEKIPDRILNCEDKPTKKQVLQLVMSIFDPVGFVEFLLSKFKLIFHWLIKDNYDWSQVMDDKYFTIWKKAIGWLKIIQNVKVPRLYSIKLSDAKIIQLVGFGDAGTEILCAVIYIRLLDVERSQIGYRFICAKSFIVPIRQSRTVPELELDIALKVAKLMKKIEVAHRIKFNEKLYFTDNVAVKEWIVNGARNPKVYVQNRLEKLKIISKTDEWRWIPTNLQPADFGTKISSMPEISYNNDWFHPLLFKIPEKNWPTIEANIDSKIVGNTSCSNFLDDDFSFILKFSSFDKLINVLMKAFEWKNLARYKAIEREIMKIKSQDCRTRSSKNLRSEKIEALKIAQLEAMAKVLKVHENHYSQIEFSLIKLAQKESFKDDYDFILTKKPLKLSNPLRKLLPYVDEHGIMRAQSRITNNEINQVKFGYDRINPIILPRDNHLTKLIILKYHISQAHHNEKTVIINLLERFHIPKIKRTVSTIIRHECMICRKKNAKPDIPLMGDLPSHRLAFHMPAFSYVIVDLLGPIHVKATKFTTTKRYVLVYSCLTTRAIHLELIENLDANATLRALQNTFNLRGVPKRICSDNGKNFVGGNNILQECHNEWNKELLSRGTIIQPIEWYFSPAKAPHMNGSVERMVGLVKKALKNIQTYMDKRHSLYDDYGLKSVLCEIINMINSRPLEIMPDDEGQHSFLTPNCFIMGKQNAQTVPPDSVEPSSFSQKWRDIKAISNSLWENWLKAYFPLMKMREKWVDRVKPLEPGDIIITSDPTIANSWRLGIIEKVIRGSQGQVRQVLIRLGKNKPIDSGNLLNSKKLVKSYKDEVDTIITRPAIAVAKLDIKYIELNK